jgi:hypothetical protein
MREPSQAEVDAVARQMLATVEEPRRPKHQAKPSLVRQIQNHLVRQRTYPPGCTCEKMQIGGPPQTYDRACPIPAHRDRAVGGDGRGWR